MVKKFIARMSRVFRSFRIVLASRLAMAAKKAEIMEMVVKLKKVIFYILFFLIITWNQEVINEPIFDVFDK